MTHPELTLSSEVKNVTGVGSARAKMFASRSIRTVEDLLYYAPFRYEDRCQMISVHDLRPGQTATIFVKVLSCGLVRTRRGKFIYDLSAGDASGVQPGGLIRCIWFNASYLERSKTFRAGQHVFFYGKAERDAYGTGNLVITQPRFEILVDSVPRASNSLEIGRITPIYEAIGPLSPVVIRRLVWAALENIGDRIPECLPPSIIRRRNLPDRAGALRQMHFPPPDTPLDALASFRTPAQQRMIFEEFFAIGVAMALKRRQLKWLPGIAVEINDRVREAIKRFLPFHPTAAQKRVLKEIVDDMRSSHPMSRLLQGDVGSGKTLVALEAAVVAIENGSQVAIMAPTEVLATQHYLYCKRLLSPLGYQPALLTGSQSAREKLQIKNLLKSGIIPLVVGTHALIEQDVEFARLALAIVDEQHRFGVVQRQNLVRKGPAPHVLVMTATPIPRTYALAAYGDLDISIINEMPPGRTPVLTRVLSESDRARTLNFIRSRILAGEQAYVICPLVEESDKLNLRPAIRIHEHLAKDVFPELRVGLLHGRLPGEEKESVMERFKTGEIQVLVSTTVVEVGVDVPNATVMLIEHAERFGLAQLHQLRGRIGRGAAKSYCFLMSGGDAGEDANERLRALADTQDGFRIAELDFQLRGPGEFLGTRQSGIPAFRIANLLRDRDILEQARREAFEFVERGASADELDDFTRQLQARWPGRYSLARLG